MIDLSSYAELHKRTDAAYQQFTEVALVALKELRKIDAELVQLAIDAYGSADAIVIAFAEPTGRDGKSVYSKLAAGQREEVRDALVRMMYGIY